MKPLSTEQIQRIHEIPPDSGIYYTLYTDAQRLEEQLEAAVRLAVAERGLNTHADGERHKISLEVSAAQSACIAIGLGAKLKLEG